MSNEGRIPFKMIYLKKELLFWPKFYETQILNNIAIFVFSLHDMRHWVTLTGQIKEIVRLLGYISHTMCYKTAELSGREASCMWIIRIWINYFQQNRYQACSYISAYYFDKFNTVSYGVPRFLQISNHMISKHDCF